MKPVLGTKINPERASRLGCINAWEFNERGGLIAIDSSLRKKQGIISGATRQYGKYGEEIYFGNSTSDVVDCGVAFLGSQLQGLTVETLIKTGTVSLDQMIAENGDAFYHNTFFLFYNNATGYFEFLIYGSGDYSYRASEVVPAANTYYHIVCIWRIGTSPEMYVDGKFQNGVTGGTFTGSSLIDGTTNLELGKRPASTSMSFNGSMTYFRIYNKSLSNGDVLKLYQNPYWMYQHTPIWMFDYTASGGTTPKGVFSRPILGAFGGMI